MATPLRPKGSLWGNRSSKRNARRGARDKKSPGAGVELLRRRPSGLTATRRKASRPQKNIPSSPERRTRRPGHRREKFSRTSPRLSGRKTTSGTPMAFERILREGTFASRRPCRGGRRRRDRVVRRRPVLAVTRRRRRGIKNPPRGRHLEFKRESAGRRGNQRQVALAVSGSPEFR